MAKKENPPSIKETAFDCPHCGAYTTQYWYDLFSECRDKKDPLPFIPDNRFKDIILKNSDINEENKKKVLRLCDKMDSGLIFLENGPSKYCNKIVNNLFISKCYNCDKISVWVHDNLVFPPKKLEIPPNQDLPEDIIRDFEEARAIVGLSPRGAAALLRLCIQKLCIHLGEKGKSIEDDIKSLVSKGLNPLIQKSLDIVRVIGNEAVHPGLINLTDDRDLANQLFILINSIADQMISHPKTVESLWEKLPQGKKDAIEKRNEKVKKDMES